MFVLFATSFIFLFTHLEFVFMFQYFERLHQNLENFPSFVYYEHHIPESDENLNYTFSTRIECQDLCNHFGESCMTVSMTPEINGNISCVLTKYPVVHLILEKLENSMTFGRLPSENTSFCLGDDGLIYTFLPKWKNLQESRDYCESDLDLVKGIYIMPKTLLQFESFLKCRIVFRQIGDRYYFHTDLIFKDNNLQWGDGSLYDETETSEIYKVISRNDAAYYTLAMRNGRQYIKEDYEHDGSYVACQIDPLLRK